VPSASWQALRTALDWACEQGMTIPGRLDEAELERLRAVFSNQQPWSFDLYQPLRAFSHVLPRLELPDLPACVHFGDCLTALNEALVRDAAESGTWSSCHTLSRQSFDALGYARTSAGISEVRARNVAGWQEHAGHSREFLLRSARASAPGTAAVIGAGKLYDVPLKELLTHFERVILIDVDGTALAESVEQELGKDSRVELVTREVTGCNEAFVQAANAIFDASPPEADCYRALVGLLHSWRWAGTPKLIEAEPLSAIFSTMVLSQLAVPLTRYLERRFEQSFPGSARWRSHELQVGLGQFSHRLQHQHVQALLGSGAALTLTSDVSERYPRLGSPPLPLLGAPHLLDLFPARSAANVSSAEWLWPRTQERLLSVNACHVSA